MEPKQKVDPCAIKLTLIMDYSLSHLVRFLFDEMKGFLCSAALQLMLCLYVCMCVCVR